jgi:hypothetical protein
MGCCICICPPIGAAGGSGCGTIGAGTIAKFNALAALADFFSSSCKQGTRTPVGEQ